MSPTTITRTEPIRRGGRLREVRAWLDLDRGWMAYIRLIPGGAIFNIAEVRVFPGDGASADGEPPTYWSGATGSLPGSLPLSRLPRLISVEDVRAAIQREYGDELEPLSPAEGAEVALLTVAGWGTQGDTPAERIAITAFYYVRALERGSTHPTRDAANWLDRSHGQVRDDLHKARSDRYGFLTGGQQGQAGGELTSKGKRTVYAYFAGLADEVVEALGITGWKDA